MHLDSDLSKHLHETRMRRRLEFRISKYFDPMGYVLNIEESLGCERIIVP
jgi:hypothetical protein